MGIFNPLLPLSQHNHQGTKIRWGTEPRWEQLTKTKMAIAKEQEEDYRTKKHRINEHV